MRRISPQRVTASKVSVKSQTAIRREVRTEAEAMRYLALSRNEDGILLDNASKAGDDPFAAFLEWTSLADEKAYGGSWVAVLWPLSSRKF
jgi:hypothetical protein